MDSEPTLKKARTVKGRSVEKKIAHDGAVLTAGFNSDGSFFYTGGEDRVIRLWDSRNEAHVKDFIGHDTEVRDICVTGDDTKMSSCGGDGRVFCWDLVTQRRVRTFEGSNEGVNAVKFNEFASIIVSADSSVRLWDPKSDSIKPIQILDTCKERVTSLCVRRTEIITASDKGNLQKFDFRTNRRLSYNMGPPVKCMYMALNDDEFAVASGLDSTMQLLAIQNERVRTIQTYTGHTCKSHKVGCCFTNTETHAVGGSEDGYIFIWDVLSSCVVKKFPAHSSVVTCVDYHPKDNCLISASADGSVALWRGVHEQM